MSTTQRALDTQELEQRVKEMYREVAEEPNREFHFTGGLAVRGSGAAGIVRHLARQTGTIYAMIPYSHAV
jgi:hypothetical protein